MRYGSGDGAVLEGDMDRGGEAAQADMRYGGVVHGGAVGSGGVV